MKAMSTQTADLATLADSARVYAENSRAESTRRVYDSSWRAFLAWCEERSLQPLPATPATVALYLAHLATGHKVSTIERALAQAHVLAGAPSPRSGAAVREVLKGIRRQLGTQQTRKAPLLVADLRAVCESLPSTLTGARDRAVLTLGFAGAFRRSELVALDVQDLAFDRNGLRVTLRRSKTDQEGQGAVTAIPYGSNPATCPVRAAMAWLEASGIREGAATIFCLGSGRRHG